MSHVLSESLHGRLVSARSKIQRVCDMLGIILPVRPDQAFLTRLALILEQVRDDLESIHQLYPKIDEVLTNDSRYSQKTTSLEN